MVLEFDNLLMIYRVLTKSIDLSKFDFADQMNRRIVKSFFNIAKSRFYTSDTYSVVKSDICMQMDRDVFGNAIKNAEFSNSLYGRIMCLLLRHKWIFPIYILSRI